MVKKKLRDTDLKKKEITLDKPYSSLSKDRYVEEDKLISEVHAVKNEVNKEEFIRAIQKKYYYGWWHKSGFNIKKKEHFHPFVNALFKIAEFLGWSKKQGDIEKIKKQLAETQGHLQSLSRYSIDLLREYELLKTQKAMAFVDNFWKDLIEFEKLVSNFKETHADEEQIQVFLQEHPWFFGLDYLDQTPKKRVGSKGTVDFYLERLQGVKDVFELKLPSHSLFDSNGKMSADLGKAITQIIDYLEDIMAYGSTIRVSEKEEIGELIGRPRGFIIIGTCKDEKTRKKMEILNAYLHGIQILSYDNIIRKAENTCRNLEEEKTKISE